MKPPIIVTLPNMWVLWSYLDLYQREGMEWTHG